jgi:hypothetical protein
MIERVFGVPELISEVQAARASLASVAERLDASVLSGADAVAVLAELGHVRRITDGLVGRAAKRAEDTSAHARGTDRSAVELTARVVGVTPGEARRSIDTAAKLEALPATAAAVRAGALSAAQADLIAGAAKDDPSVEGELLRVAARGTVPLKDAVIAAKARREDERERRKRQRTARFHRMWMTGDGMVAGAYQLPPEEGAALKAAIEGETQRIFRERRSSDDREPQERYAADALVTLVTGGTDDADRGTSKRGKKGKVDHTVHVLIDHDALTRGEARDGETCEIPGVGPVSVEWVRGLLGEAFVTAVITKGKDIRNVAHFGRHIPAELRTALLVGGRECCVEGCTARGYLEIDHTDVDFAAGGPTALWNLDWQCWTHHHLKSQGWRLGPRDPVTGKRRLDPPGDPPGAARAA